MDDSDIKDLFNKVAEHFDGADEGAKGMFAMLVRTTLDYRDKLIHSTGDPLTVAETREALNAFMFVLRTQKFPANLGKRPHSLVMIWLEELKQQRCN